MILAWLAVYTIARHLFDWLRCFSNLFSAKHCKHLGELYLNFLASAAQSKSSSTAVLL